MKRLVLVGEGQGDTLGLPVLARKVLRDRNWHEQFFLDDEVIRAGNPSGLVKWDKQNNREDCSRWLKYLRYAAGRKDLGAVLAVFDGDASTFPAGAKTEFCPATAARKMAALAQSAGAGHMFSLAVVFACVEFETWLVAGAGQTPSPGVPILFPGVAFPAGDPESHGKGWIAKQLPGYRETRDQKVLTELLDLDTVRAKGLRSFKRLENAMEQLVNAMISGAHISSPF